MEHHPDCPILDQYDCGSSRRCECRMLRLIAERAFKRDEERVEAQRPDGPDRGEQEALDR